jgi:hypothetical protein
MVCVAAEELGFLAAYFMSCITKDMGLRRITTKFILASCNNAFHSSASLREFFAKDKFLLILNTLYCQYLLRSGLFVSKTEQDCNWKEI